LRRAWGEGEGEDENEVEVEVEVEEVPLGNSKLQTVN
jgi:hypothetical protein